MKLFLLLFFANALILLSSANDTYFVVLKKPLDLAEGAGYQQLSADAQTTFSAFANVTSASIQENLKNQVFTLNGVKGMKFFHQFKNSATVKTQNQNAKYPFLSNQLKIY